MGQPATRQDPHPTRRPRRLWLGVSAACMLSVSAVGVFLLGYSTRHYAWIRHSRIERIHEFVQTKVLGQWTDDRLASSIRWHRIERDGSGATGMPGDTAAELDALGYLDGYEKAADQDGARILDATRVAPGLTLIVSAHTTGASLIDLDGAVVHRWNITWAEACPGRPTPEVELRDFWNRALLLDDGGLIVIFDYLAMARIDRDSHLVWSRCEPFHHDVVRAAPGADRLLALRRRARTVHFADSTRDLLDDEIVELSMDGVELSSLSVFDALAESPFAPVLIRFDDRPPLISGDYLHTNSVKPMHPRVPSRLEAVREGNWLVSIRNLDLVGIIDPATRHFVWANATLWRHQHEPVLLDDGHILVFDNEGADGRSRVIEIEPSDLAVKWVYDGGESASFESDCCGMAQRLPNGNTLVTVTTSGYAFEVTPEGDRVWEYRNPERTGPDLEFVATLFRTIRLDGVAATAWLTRPHEPSRAAIPAPSRAGGSGA